MQVTVPGKLLMCVWGGGVYGCAWDCTWENRPRSVCVSVYNPLIPILVVLCAVVKQDSALGQAGESQGCTRVAVWVQ